jgi:tropomyosin, fungi type
MTDADSCTRLRQTDVKAGHFERKVQALEQTNSQLEAKLDELNTKYKESQSELERFAAELGSL